MKTLIIKLGALGDVVRTTVLLNELEEPIFWLTKRNAKDLLSSNKLSRVFFIEEDNDIKKLKKIKFDLIISLDEERKALEILKKLETKKLVGIFLNKTNGVDYTNEANTLCNMSLISKFGKTKADLLKKQNIKSIPEILINMIGKGFKGQDYNINLPIKSIKGKIGLIDISASVWPNKYWGGYKQLAELLGNNGHEVALLRMRNTLRDHIDDINSCEIIVCGDTLGMHVALALKKKIVALFNCTPPNEIHDYGRMIKIVSPLWNKYFFSKDFDEEAISAISVNEVYNAITKESILYFTPCGRQWPATASDPPATPAWRAGFTKNSST